MSKILRSVLVVAALVGSVSAASATVYGFGSGNGKTTWKKSHDTRGFFDQLKKNGS